MGLFHVKGHLTGPTGRVEEVELLVDTGATLSVVPRSLAERLELKPTRSQRVVIAGGQRDVWPIAEARLALNGDEITTPCFIAPEGPALLGAVALESLFLAVDPVGKRLVPVDGFSVSIGSARRLSIPIPRCILFTESPYPLSPARSAESPGRSASQLSD
jgi:aspartyl protease family protein